MKIIWFIFFIILFSNRVKSLYRTSLTMRTKKTDISKNTIPPSSITTRYIPRTENQHTYISHLSNTNTSIVFGIGPAGCGKTMFACVKAIEGLRSGLYEKIVLTRPIIPVEEEELGYLPGSLVRKMDPWTRPIMDIFLEHYKKQELEKMVQSGVIEISPLAYMRGRTFKRCFIIADEMQNSSPSQMLMLTTRIGEDSKMVITGDLNQSDRCLENGLLDIIQKISIYRKKNHSDLGIEMVEMDKEDIQRSKVVSTILEIFNKDDVSPKTVEKPKTIRRPKIPNFDVASNNDAALIPLATLPRITNTKGQGQDWF